MSYSKFREETASTEFAAFLKAGHLKGSPATLDLLKVDEQELPQTGRSLVARFDFNTKAKAQFTPDYVKSLEKVNAKDIGFPLNATNGKKLAEIFGDQFSKWHGSITLKIMAAINPKTKEEVDVLRIVVPDKSKGK